jgi:hypothetical protein
MNPYVQTSIVIGEISDESFDRDTWIDPELDRWTRRNAVLALKFSTDLAGNNKSASVYFGFVVQIAGDYIWATSRSIPDWAELDVDGLQREILQERLRLDEIATGNFNISLAAFYSFLFRREYLSKEATVRIMQRLEKYDNAYVSETFTVANKRLPAPRIRSARSSYLRRRTVDYANTPTSK